MQKKFAKKLASFHPLKHNFLKNLSLKACISIVIVWTLLSPFLSPLALAVSDEAIYEQMMLYYDDSECAVTFTLDDHAGNETHLEIGELDEWNFVEQTFPASEVYYSIGVVVGWIITNSTQDEWANLQDVVDAGYAEIANHSWNHTDIPYDDADSVSYTLQIVQSANYIKGYLDLASFQRKGEDDYVYTWIEPYGASDAEQMALCGETGYLLSRRVAQQNTFSTWSNTYGIYNRYGYKTMIDAPVASTLNDAFDSAYSNNQIYHAFGHPKYWDTQGEKDAISEHLTYIKQNASVWYVPIGAMYQYHYIQERNSTFNLISVSTQGLDQDKTTHFAINNATARDKYGLMYPMTYRFSIQSTWENAYAYYRFSLSESWELMPEKTASSVFSGILASRFDFNNDKAYLSIGFPDSSEHIYIKVRSTVDTGISPTAEWFTERIVMWMGIAGGGFLIMMPTIIVMLLKENEFQLAIIVAILGFTISFCLVMAWLWS